MLSPSTATPRDFIHLQMESSGWDLLGSVDVWTEDCSQRIELQSASKYIKVLYIRGLCHKGPKVTVMSPADYAAGFRRWAPEAPSEAGAFIAEARKRYEREPLGWESKKKWQLRQDLHLHLCPSFILLCSPPLNGTVIKSDHYIVLANLTMTKTALTNAAFKPHWLPGKTLRGCAKSWSGFSKWGSLRVLVCACKV